MEKIKRKFEKIKAALKKFERLRLRKMHLDYLAGLLTLPVLLTAIVLNLNNLNRPAAPVKENASPSPQVIIIPATSAPVPTISNVCKKSVGPVIITYPQEGQTVADNPVCILIDYSDQNYCSVVWSYSINNGSWSDYNTNAPCLYNLPNGSIQFQLRVNSTVSTDTKTFIRNFTYTGANNPVITPTPTLTVTPTPTLTPIPTPLPTSSSASSSAQ